MVNNQSLKDGEISVLAGEFSMLFSSDSRSGYQPTFTSEQHSLEQPPLYPYVPTYTTYGVSQEAIR